MIELLRRDIGGRVAVARATDRSDGDMHPDDPGGDLRRRQRSLVGSSWVMLDQQHGVDVCTLRPSSQERWPVAAAGDVLVAPAGLDAAIAVWAADCAPVVLFGTEGTRVVAHAGWRGLAGGVIDAAVDAVDDVAVAVLGPSIHPCCYEFGLDELEAVAQSLALDVDAVRASTSWGATAFDVPGAIASVLRRRGIVLDVVGPCTGCDERFHSHRRRGESERHAVVAWFEEAS